MSIAASSTPATPTRFRGPDLCPFGTREPTPPLKPAQGEEDPVVARELAFADNPFRPRRSALSATMPSICERMLANPPVTSRQ